MGPSSWLFQMVVNYILTHLAQLAAAVGANVDWKAVAATAVAAVEGLVDGFLPQFVQDFVNPGIAALVNGAVEAISLALSDSTDLSLILADLTAKDYPKALADLEALLAKVVHPSQAPTLAAVQQLKLAA